MGYENATGERYVWLAPTVVEPSSVRAAGAVLTKHPNHARFDRVNPAISGTRRIDRRQSRAVSEAGKMKTALCAAAIALLSTSLAAALAPQTARADVTATFDVSGTAEAVARGQTCGKKCAFFGTLMINVTTGAATAVDITFPGLAALDTLDRSHKSGTDWSIAADNGDDFATLVFTTTPTPGSLVGFAGGSINFGGTVVEIQPFKDLYAVLTGTIAGPVAVAAVPEASTWAMMALGFGLLGFLSYRKTRSENALA